MPSGYSAAASELWRKTLGLARDSIKPATQPVYETGIRLFHDYILEMCPDLTLPLRDADWAMLFAWHTERVKPSSASNYITHVAFMLEVQCRLPRPIWKHLPLYSRVKRARKLKFGRSRNKKLPLTFRLAVRIQRDMGLTPDNITDNDLVGATFLCIMFVGVCGLFRLGELLLSKRKGHDPLKVIRRGQVQMLRRSDFGTAGGTVARIWLYTSKGDIYSDGTPVFLPANIDDRNACPVAWLTTVIRLSGAAGSGDNVPLFRTKDNKLMLKSSFTKWLKQRLLRLGFNPKLYAGHSLRRGGAVSAQRSGVPDHVIQRMGRWRSQAYQLYLKHTPQRLQNLKEHLLALKAIRSDC